MTRSYIRKASVLKCQMWWTPPVVCWQRSGASFQAKLFTAQIHSSVVNTNFHKKILYDSRRRGHPRSSLAHERWTTVNTKSWELKQIICSSCQIDRIVIDHHPLTHSRRVTGLSSTFWWGELRPVNERSTAMTCMTCLRLPQYLEKSRIQLLNYSISDTMKFSRMICTSPYWSPVSSLFSWKFWSILRLIEKQKRVIAENLEDLLKLTLNFVETILEILPKQWATTMHTKKWRITYMLWWGLLQRVAMHFWSRWELQSQNWSDNLIATGQWKHEHPFDTNTTFRAEKHSLERHNHARVCPIEGSNSELLYFRLLLLGFLWILCRMNVSTITWMNSPNRGHGRQRETTRTWTIIDRIQIGQCMENTR